jgi:hypothetical protein
MSAGRHLCGDSGTFLIAAAEIRQGLQATTAIPTLIATVAPRGLAEPLELALDASPPSFLARTSQLRI